jgi:hypothetical protein
MPAQPAALPPAADHEYETLPAAFEQVAVSVSAIDTVGDPLDIEIEHEKVPPPPPPPVTQVSVEPSKVKLEQLGSVNVIDAA